MDVGNEHCAVFGHPRLSCRPAGRPGSLFSERTMGRFKLQEYDIFEFAPLWRADGGASNKLVRPAPISDHAPTTLIDSEWEIACDKFDEPPARPHLPQRSIQFGFELTVSFLHDDSDTVAEEFRLKEGIAFKFAALIRRRTVEPERQADGVIEDHVDLAPLESVPRS